MAFDTVGIGFDLTNFQLRAFKNDKETAHCQRMMEMHIMETLGIGSEGIAANTDLLGQLLQLAFLMGPNS